MGNKKLQSLFREWLSVEGMTENMPKILAIVADNQQLELRGWKVVNNRIAPDKLRSHGNDKDSIEVEFFDKDTKSTKIVTFESFKKLDNLLVKRLNELEQFYIDLHPHQPQKLVTVLENKEKIFYQQQQQTQHQQQTQQQQVPYIDIDAADIPY